LNERSVSTKKSLSKFVFDAFRFVLGWAMPPKFTLLKLLRQKVVPEEQVILLLLDVEFPLK